MKKIFLASLLAVVSLFFFTCSSAQAATVAQTLSGRIVLDPSTAGKAWYISPVNHDRYVLASAADAAFLINKLGAGISEANFQKIAQGGTTPKGDVALAKKLAGRILLEVERQGQAWYVNPVDLKKYYLASPTNALNILLKFGAAITPANLAKIHKAVESESVNNFSSYTAAEKISTGSGTFSANVAKIDLSAYAPKIITASAGVNNCTVNCPTEPLVQLAVNQRAFAAIAGVYGVPFYDSPSKTMINANRLSASAPLIAFDVNNKFYYYSSANQFSAKNFSSINGAALAAAFVGRVKLVENGQVKSVAASVRTVRNAFGYKQGSGNPLGTVYLVSASNVTLAQLAKVMKTLGVDYAVSLDSGAYNAFFYGDEYKVGPGSNVPNAILFAAK
jgi:Phosphodiester glycosidase